MSQPSDIRVKIGFLDHPKVKLLMRDAGENAVICLLRIWMHAAANAPRGDLTPMTDDEIEACACWSGAPGMLVASLRNRRLLDGTVLHDWSEHQPWAYLASERSSLARAAAKTRWQNKIRPNATSIQSACSDADSMRAACGGHAEGIQPAMPSSLLFSSLPKEKKKRSVIAFTKPTFEEVEAYCTIRGTGVNAEKWYAHYESNGWKVGKNPMRNWKASVVFWEHNGNA